MSEAKLTIYQASAGSGKTYTLAREYICMLFDSIIKSGAIRHPDRYAQFRHIHRELLAVTFTNKATNEMKSRIVRELYKLASHQDSDYRQILCQLAGLNDSEKMLIDQWCRYFLDDILDDYGTFAITTIDSFFQKIVRQFARELNLPGGYALDMDEKQIRTIAVDNLLYDIDRHKTLRLWLQQMISERIDNGKDWNIQADILDKAKVLFNERFRELISKPDVEQMLQHPARYKKILYDIVQNQSHDIDEVIKRLLSTLTEYGLSITDIKTNADLNKLKTWVEIKKTDRTFSSIIGARNIEKCFNKKAITKGRAQEAFDGGVYDCYREAYDIVIRCATARNIIQTFYIIGIIGNIDRQIESDNRENNRLPIADTNRRLHEIIDDSDIPFIYEKISQRIRHYLIDEFQDTSTLQWDNFRPLIQESLDSGNTNLIVGDVKQSIYRWRNGDADLLAYKVQQDIPEQYIEFENLKTNYRSCAQIIRWNNTFFKYLIDCIAPQGVSLPTDDDNDDTEAVGAEIINPKIVRVNTLYRRHEDAFKEEIQQYYTESGIEQKINPKNNYSGMVRFSYLNPTEETDYDTLIEKYLIELLDELTIKRHIKPKKIAIMVRKNKEGNQTANILVRHGYKVVSADSLTMSASASVQLIINTLRHNERPKERLYIYNFYYFLATLLGKDIAWCMDQTRHYTECLNNDEQSLLADTLLGKAIELLEHSGTLYEKTEFLIDWIVNGSGADSMVVNAETAYLQALLDSIHQFAANQSTDIHAFLQWWDTNGSTQAIPAPEQEDAIQIITIHKAKGLEFDVAIMPFCFFAFVDNKNNILWVEPQQEQMSDVFCQIPLVPVTFSSKLENTECAQVYYREYKQRFLDTLNTLYVAFTRPRYELYIFSQKRETQAVKKDEFVGNFLLQYVTQHLQLQNVSTNAEIDIYQVSDTAGRLDWRTKEDEKSSIESVSIPDLLLSTPISSRLTIQENSTEATIRGNLLHDIMSHISTIDDIDTALIKSCTGTNEQLIGTLREQITDLINLPQVKPWFTDDNIVLNEMSLLTATGSQFRPDRIMLYPDGTIIVIDYKFTAHRSNKYNEQVQQYMNILREAMPEYEYGTSVVKTRQIRGYLLYADSKTIEEVR